MATINYKAYKMLGEPRSHDRIATVANVTPDTIRNHYKEFLDLLGLPRVSGNPTSRPTSVPSGQKGTGLLGTAD